MRSASAITVCRKRWGPNANAGFLSNGLSPKRPYSVVIPVIMHSEMLKGMLWQY